MNGLAVFAGGGCLDFGLKEAAGIQTVCYVEKDDYAAACLMSRIRAGQLDDAPIWDDVCTFDGRPWRGQVDIVTGGFPCTDISTAGKGRGITTETRSGLWYEQLRIIGEVRLGFVFVENVAALHRRGLNTVLGGLAEEGYDARWCCVQAREVGAPHKRERLFILAHAPGVRLEGAQPTRRQRVHGDAACAEDNAGADDAHLIRDGCVGAEPAEHAGAARQPAQRQTASSIPASDAHSQRRQRRRAEAYSLKTSFAWAEGVRNAAELRGRPDIPEPLVCRTVYGAAHGVERIRLLRNAVVPAQAAEAWRRLTGGMTW